MGLSSLGEYRVVVLLDMRNVRLMPASGLDPFFDRNTCLTVMTDRYG